MPVSSNAMTTDNDDISKLNFGQDLEAEVLSNKFGQDLEAEIWSKCGWIVFQISKLKFD